MLAHYEGPIWYLVQQYMPSALGEDLSACTACERRWPDVFLLETVPCALCILMPHTPDSHEAIVGLSTTPSRLSSGVRAAHAVKTGQRY